MAGSMQTTFNGQAKLSGLEACNNYWVVVTAIYCGRRSDSVPTLTGYSDAVQLKLSVSLSGSGMTCNDWVSTDAQQKVMDVESGLRNAEASCGFQIPCFKDSSWQCLRDDSSQASFQ